VAALSGTIRALALSEKKRVNPKTNPKVLDLNSGES
jgi:hypothetical protein